MVLLFGMGTSHICNIITEINADGFKHYLLHV